MPGITLEHPIRVRANDSSQDGNGNGDKLATSTKIGIAVGLILFAILLLSFYMVARYRVKRKPPTAEDEFNTKALNRWMGNVAKPEATRKGSVSTGGKARRTSESTLATYESNASGIMFDDTPPLRSPQKAHLTQPSAQYRAQ